jgi:hypothetical protein
VSEPLELESVDLAKVAQHLMSACGGSVEGAVVGRTRLRDEVVGYLQCSQLEGEQVLDTMINRGFVVKRSEPDGCVHWDIAAPAR